MEGLPVLHLGPAALRPTGLLAVAGGLVAAGLAARAARRDGVPRGALLRLAAWAVPGAIVGAHLVHLLAYHPEELADAGALWRLGDGLSSAGGIAGGLLGALAAARGRLARLAPLGDALALGLAPSWAIGRIGCALVHDHPGLRLAGPLSFAAPGGPRLDLGLAEALLLALLAALLAALRATGAARGRLLAVLAVGYGAGRLGLDFLRAADLPGSDVRWGGLTPAQWGALALLAWGAAALRRARVFW